MIPLLLALLSPAQADEIDAWIELYDGILVEAADNDVDEAVRTYQGLTRTLAADEPVRGVALYWLGRALESDGDTDGARYALRECVRAGGARTRCLDLLGRIELESAAVRRVPTVWNLEDGQHGFIHPWLYADKGSIRLGSGDDTHKDVLVWATRVSPDLDDQLLLGFTTPAPGPSGVRMTIRPMRQDWALRVVAFDVHNNQYVATLNGGIITAERGRWRRVDIELSTFQALEGSRRLRPSELDHIVLQDVSAFQGTPSGPNELWLANIRVY
ncbi:MAG: hypothetical protein ACJAV2_000674 [Myxococcota bacterium]|jgi:hypothetical protein